MNRAINHVVFNPAVDANVEIQTAEIVLAKSGLGTSKAASKIDEVRGTSRTNSREHGLPWLLIVRPDVEHQHSLKVTPIDERGYSDLRQEV
jgi:hypothetical protein